MRRPTSLLIALVLINLAACAPGIRYGADFMSTHDFTRYSTFVWEGADALPTGDPRLDANPFFEARVRDAVQQELAARDIVPDGDPELRVHFHAAVRERLEVIEPDQTRSLAGLDEPEVRIWEEGTLLVDLVDAYSGAVVWRGWAQTDVTGLARNPVREEARIREAIRLMFLQFPR